MLPLSTIFVGLQGAFGIVNGAASLLFQSAAEKNVGILNIPSVPAIHAIAAGSVSIGYVQCNSFSQFHRLVAILDVGFV